MTRHDQNPPRTELAVEAEINSLKELVQLLSGK